MTLATNPGINPPAPVTLKTVEYIDTYHNLEKSQDRNTQPTGGGEVGGVSKATRCGEGKAAREADSANRVVWYRTPPAHVQVKKMLLASNYLPVNFD